MTTTTVLVYEFLRQLVNALPKGRTFKRLPETSELIRTPMLTSGPVYDLSLEKIEEYAKDVASRITPEHSACRELPLPQCVDIAERCVDPRSGLSVRYLQAFDLTEGVRISRFDVGLI